MKDIQVVKLEKNGQEVAFQVAKNWNAKKYDLTRMPFSFKELDETIELDSMYLGSSDTADGAIAVANDLMEEWFGDGTIYEEDC